MTVKVSKPAINVREELADLRKPTGIAGEAMLRAETPQEQFNLIGAGRRNLILNGDFSVWQRGTSFTGGNTYGSADRWVTYASGNGLTYSRSTNVPSGSGLAYSMTTSGTPSGEFILSQGIELPAAGIAGVFYKGQQITISYYAKSSVSGDKLRHFMAFRTGSTSSSNQAYFENNSDQNTLSTEWKKFSNTYTITVDPHSTSLCLAINIRSRDASNTSSTPAGNISVTGVQLEVGKVATPFEHRSFAEELAACQRYYTKWNIATNWSGYQNGTSIVDFNVYTPVPMRNGSPSLSCTGSFYVWRQNGYQQQTAPSIGIGSGGTQFHNNAIYCQVGNFSNLINGYVANVFINTLEVDDEL